MTLALVAALLVAGAGGASPDPARVFLRADDEELTGSLALALVDDGFEVTGDPQEATHDIAVAPGDGGGFVLTCVGAEPRGATVAAGPPALVEVELRHRVASLARTTPARPARAARPVVAVEIVDRGTPSMLAERLRDRTASALLEAGLTLGPPERAPERLCVAADVDLVTLSWGGTGARCDGRPVAIARPDLVARVLVAEALRLRDAAPLKVADVARDVAGPAEPATSRAPPPLAAERPVDVPPSAEAPAAPAAPA